MTAQENTTASFGGSKVAIGFSRQKNVCFMGSGKDFTYIGQSGNSIVSSPPPHYSLIPGAIFWDIGV